MRFCLLLALLLPSCRSHFRHFREIEVRGLSQGEVWRESARALLNLYARLDPVHTDRGLLRMRSRWATRRGPFRGGRRNRAHLEIHPGGEEAILVRFYIEKQRNGNMARAFEPLEEDWEDAGQDGRREEHLHYLLRSLFAHARGESAPGLQPLRPDDPMKSRNR